MKYFLIVLAFFCQNAFSQSDQLKGIVLNADDNSALASASIFINNASVGTLSDANGKFTLNGIAQKNFELIISYTGFSTVSLKITPENVAQFHTIKMVPRKEMLEGISIMVPEKDGWKTWGKFFTESFLGESDFAKQCIIENPKVLRFFNDKEHNRLTAYSNGNLIVRNKALGYLIKYQLEEFDYDFKNKIITYVGYTGFEDLKTRSSKKRSHWLKARAEAYYGSIMHFMRSLYADSILENGFDVREKIRINNNDSLFNKIYLPGNMPAVRIGNNTYKARPGEIPEFKKIPDYVDLINLKSFSFKDALTFNSATKQKELYFDNSLQVIYKNANFKMDYLIKNGMPKYLKMNQLSTAYLVNTEPLEIEKDGSYFDPMNLMSYGYWGWCKMAEMLPIDYQPGIDSLSGK
ncbi:MAG TPA: carboxypeptidase-like regulatory domain-containing protein [Hanamia sp.]|nr:carboxypeptidase-like regulatory domain-containing protein [Hanamia sp.]